MPELQKLSGSQDVKETAKPKRQTSKKLKGADDNNDDIEKPTPGKEENSGTLKSKKGTKTGARGRKPSKRKKSEESEDDNDGDAATDEDDDMDQAEKKKPDHRGARRKAK